jgi:hypothetical protein
MAASDGAFDLYAEFLSPFLQRVRFYYIVEKGGGRQFFPNILKNFPHISYFSLECKIFSKHFVNFPEILNIFRAYRNFSVPHTKILP